MKNNYLLFVFIIMFCFIAEQSQAENSQLWTEVSSAKTSKMTLVHRASQPEKYKLFKLDIKKLKESLTRAPDRETAKGVSHTIVEFPGPEGVLTQFRVFESPVMHPELAAKFPMIKTYAAQGIDDPTATMRFSVTQFGLHTMTLSGTGSAVYIDPYSENNEYYMVYDRNSLAKGDNRVDFECLTDEGFHVALNRTSQISRDTNDQKLKIYRLAQSCTAEYGNIFAVNPGTELADIQAQMTITINRVNEIYERDLAITLQFIANNDQLIYWGNTSGDPWNSEWNDTTQQVIDNSIGNANYDIGHNFNTSGGGNAGCLACVCTTGKKGSAYTGRADPTGDPFDIDYVAHEIGHQFGGYHTMNTCSRSGNGMTEVEPASGSSIMGYAGICETNVQSSSDAHFNYVNIRDISDNVQPGGNSTCGVETALGNNPPTADAGADYTIPQGTAFVLEGTATDPDGMTSLTYNWSQNDPEEAPDKISPQSTWTVGPLYRSKLPISSPNRYLPQFSDVRVGNLTPTWEVTPSVSRDMEFSFIVRDNGLLGGQTNSDLMSIRVDGNSGPFAVTSQINSESWDAGTHKTITWNVAGTNIAPVNAATVDILITADGGSTFTTAASNIANNGSYTITVPTGIFTSTARVMVRGHNNIFYAINSADITIHSSDFAMNFAATSVQTCAPADAVFTFIYNTYNGFSETTTFSATGNPAGSLVTFSPAQAMTDGTAVSMTVSGVSSDMAGQYVVTATGTANSATKDVSTTLHVNNNIFSPVNMTAPVDGASNIAASVTLRWDVDTNADEYTVEIATDVLFTNIIETATVGANAYQTASLSEDTEYFWHVRAANLCGTGNYSTAHSFTTQSCTVCASSGNIEYQTSTTLVTFNTINNTSGKPAGYTDYTAISTNVELSNAYNLTVHVNTDGEYTTSSKAWIDWNQDCDFDDAGEEYDLGTGVNVPDGQTSNSPLSISVPAGAALGKTVMRISTRYDTGAASCESGFDGEVEDYAITVISPASCIIPSALSVTNETGSGADLGWTETGSATVWDLEIGSQGFTPTGTASHENVNSNPYIWGGGLPDSSYEFYVRADCGGGSGESNWAGPFTFTTSEQSCSLCVSSGTTDYGTSTTLVSFNTINNTSGKPSGYTDYTAISTDVELSDAYNLTVHVNTDGDYTTSSRAWIDWNQDCDFDDAGEEYDLGTGVNVPDGQTSNSPLSISVPAGATLGKTVMRISTRYDTGATSCEGSFDGEVEDYAITVISPASCIIPSALSVANETSSGADLGWIETGSATVWDLEIGSQGFTPTGTASHENINSNPYTWGGGLPDSSYDFYVRADCGGGAGESNWAGPFTFATAASVLPCPDPSALSAANATSSGADLGWTETGSATVWDLEIGSQGFAPSGTPSHDSVSSNPYTWNGGLPNSSYDFYVRADCGGVTTGKWVGPFTFTTIGSSCTLCASSGNMAYGTSTTLVSFNTINSVSGKPSGYSDYTANSTNVELANSYDLTVNVNTDGDYTVYTKVWINWNQDCDFDDEGEEYDLGAGNSVPDGQTSNSPLSITVPAGASLGTTVMRVSTRYNSEATSCRNEFDGEVEDYAITVISPPSCATPSALSVANETSSGADLGWMETGSATVWDLEIGSQGFIPTGTASHDNVSSNPYTWGGGFPETSYDFYVRADCTASGGAGLSNWIGPLTINVEAVNGQFPWYLFVPHLKTE